MHEHVSAGPELLGLHHVTAVTAEARANLAFFTRILGMRLVKKTVNQDDVRAYHLFYADARGTPGTDLTFFDWPMAARERPGAHSITRTALRVAGADAVAWWADRLDDAGLRHDGVVERAGRPALDATGPEGFPFTLVGDEDASDAVPWDHSPVPAARQIRGLGPIELTVPLLTPTAAVLERVLGMRRAGTYADPLRPEVDVSVFAMASGGAGAEVHVREVPGEPPARPGAGGVHHVAFRVADREGQRAFLRRLDDLRIPNSGEVERFYFRSLYFREPNGILFEIATDGPGFAIDEREEDLGERLALPPFLEPRRADIEANLRPLDAETLTSTTGATSAGDA